MLLAVMALLCGGCTQNHGHIGRLFGTWFLYEYTADGEPLSPPNPAETFWSFQSDIIMMTVVEADGYFSKHFGTWVETDNELILNYYHKTDADAPGTGGYGIPSWLGLPSTDNVVLKYIEKEQNRMAFRYDAADGTVYEYFLKRTH